MSGGLNLEHLRLFCAVVEHRSFSQAARALGVTRSHASQVVSALERELGVRLLGRTTRRVTPTREGLSLFERSAGPLETLAGARAQIERERVAIAGEVSITTTSELAESVLAPLAARFTQAHPHARLRVLQTWRAVDLAAEGFDFAIRVGKPSTSALVARPMGALELGLYAAPGYLARRAIGTHALTDEALSELDWIVARPAELPRARMRAMIEPDARGIPDVAPEDARVVADSFAFARAVACAEGGVATLPTFTVHEEVRAGRLVRIAPQRALRMPLFLLYPAGQRMPRRAAAFRDLALAGR